MVFFIRLILCQVKIVWINADMVAEKEAAAFPGIFIKFRPIYHTFKTWELHQNM